jgi:hypothetical protein
MQKSGEELESNRFSDDPFSKGNSSQSENSLSKKDSSLV